MNTEQEIRKNTILISFVIGLHFLWCGSAYLSWLYNLMDIIDTQQIAINIDLLSECLGYVFQVLGVVVLCTFIKKTNIAFRNSRTIFMIISVLHMLLVAPSSLASSYSIVLITGYINNLLIGIETGYYLVMITEMIPSNRRGFAYGLGYSIGSIGSWLLSLCGDNNFLKSPSVIVVYTLIITITLGLLMLVNPDIIPEKSTTAFSSNNKLIILTGIMIFLLCFVKGIGFYFPMADVANGGFSLELSRAFYAIGLLLAGLLNDYKRFLGGIACIAALIFPFILIALKFSPEYGLYVWIMGYIFTGFYAVYRVIVFSDISDNTMFGLFLAPVGLLCGRLGDALCVPFGISLSGHPNVLVIVGAIVFITTVILCYFIFDMLYRPNAITKAEAQANPSENIAAFAIYHDLSTREKEVLPLILGGKSNSEISGELFVSENTVKFHVRNILKKTGCSNRQELFKIFSNYSNK